METDANLNAKAMKNHFIVTFGTSDAFCGEDKTAIFIPIIHQNKDFGRQRMDAKQTCR